MFKPCPEPGSPRGLPSVSVSTALSRVSAGSHVQAEPQPQPSPLLCSAHVQSRSGSGDLLSLCLYDLPPERLGHCPVTGLAVLLQRPGESLGPLTQLTVFSTLDVSSAQGRGG